MLAVTSALPQAPTRHPTFVMVHGAANSAKVWTYWQEELAARGWASHAVDLRGHGESTPTDLSRVSMRDYAGDVGEVISQLSTPPVVMGWSMGGLVAQMAAATSKAMAWVGLEQSPPALQVYDSLPLRAGVYGSEAYGITSR